MNDKIQRYYELKQQHKEAELELAQIREELVAYCVAAEVNELEADGYRLKLIQQDRKDYDEAKLYQALPDPEVWRLLSKPDASKINSLIKLNIITEETLKGTYAIKPVPVLQVNKV